MSSKYDSVKGSLEQTIKLQIKICGIDGFENGEICRDKDIDRKTDRQTETNTDTDRDRQMQP